METLKRLVDACRRREAELRARAPHDECERLRKELDDLKEKMAEDEKKNMRMKKVRGKMGERKIENRRRRRRK